MVRMKNLILLLLILTGCSSSKQLGYLSYSKDYVKKEKYVIKTFDIEDVNFMYTKLTKRQLDTSKINPYYDESTLQYYFYVEQKKLKDEKTISK